MIFPSFQYYKAPSLNEALNYISKLKNGFVFMSGGTDLVPQIKQETVCPKYVISLYGIPELSQIENQDFISIGSQVTLSDLASNPIISKHLPWLSEIISNIATPQIRNRATVGGNLLANNRCIYYNQSLLIRSAHSLCFKAGGEVCHLIPNVKHSDTPLCQARFISDLAAVFLLLDSYVVLKSKDIERKVKLREFYLPDGINRNILKSGEILTHIEITLPQKAKIYYEKL
ncbi:MAG: FAD binding domain-containing protein, partial [Deltaproteobacteria bacterium]|nr:FAD binding domain-containing protein [Deltaproteobacteria bacterium]